MSYQTIVALARDYDIQSRIAACAAAEGITNPVDWTAARMWELAASPGWGDAWASAVLAEVQSPGSDESVITDPMILAAVQAMNTPPEDPA